MARPVAPTLPRRIGKIMLVLLVLLGAFLLFQTSFLASCGGSPSGKALERIKSSPQYDATLGAFANKNLAESKATIEFMEAVKEQFFDEDVRLPPRPLPVDFPDPTTFPERPEPGLRAIWFGHSAVLIEIDGFRVFTDPVFAERVSPFKSFGPGRSHPAPVPLKDLPTIDAVVISHDHYDHLDQETAEYLTARGTRYFVGLGIGAHLRAWGVPEDRIVELDWGQSGTVEIAGANAGADAGEETVANDGGDTKGRSLTIHCTPAVHYSGRGLHNKDSTLWASWTVIGPTHRVYYSGDTGYSDHFAKTGEEFGPFDLTVIKVGHYDDTWNNIHLLPEDAVQGHVDLRGRTMLGTHWATFDMGWHPWQEPIERTVKAAREQGIQLVAPRPGQVLNVKSPGELEAWWENI